MHIYDLEGTPKGAFIQNAMLVTKGQLRLLDTSVAGLHRDTRVLLNHLVASLIYLSRRKSGELRFVPVDRTFFREHHRDAEWEELVERGVLEVREARRFEGLARRFRITRSWFATFVEAGAAEIGDGVPVLYDAVTGKLTRRRIKSLLTGPSTLRMPDLVTEAARAIRGSVFNDSEMRAFLDERRLVYEAATGEAERWRSFRRYLNDANCYGSLYSDGAEKLGTGPLAVYDPPYKPQLAGRLSEIGGGLQGASREMKERARRGVPDCHNWDLRSSQVCGAIVLMERAGLAAVYLRSYLSEPKEAWAKRVGLSVDDWKDGFYALLMGARAPTPGQLPYAKGAVADIFWNPNDLRGTLGSYTTFYEATAEMRGEITAWHDHLVDVWAPENAYSVGRNGDTYIANAVGASASTSRLGLEGKRYEGQQILASFLLQGLEVSIIHRIVLLGEKYGFEVWSHEHDGLVTKGDVPEAAVDEAACAAGVPRWAVDLVEKPFI